MTGKPILATRASDIDKYFENGKNIFLAEPENVEPIAEAMISIFRNYSKALEISEAGRKNALQIFGFESETRKIIKFVHNDLRQ